MTNKELFDAAFPQRLRLARQFRGWTQEELAEKVEVTRQFIHQVESESKPAPEGLRSKLAENVGFEVRFFAAPIQIEVREEDCFLRSRRTTPLHVRNRVLAHGTLFAEFVAWLDRNLRLPEVALPHAEARSAEEIEGAAEACRAAWGLTLDAPIENMTRVLERAGVVVTTFSGISEKVDAFSWAGRRPLVIRTADKGHPARSRFDLAHECGHLVLHRGLSTEGEGREREADRFASAFLLPRRGFVREFPRGGRTSWAALIALKERWGASLGAIVRRAHDLRLTTSDEYRSANIHMSKRGWRTSEPGDVAAEHGELIASALGVARDKLGISSADIAHELGWKRERFEELTGITAGATRTNVVALRSRR